jgi:hypothetical protein
MEQSEKALRALIVCYDKEDKVYKDRVVELLGEENTLTPTYKEGDLKDPQTFLKDFKEVIKDTQATIVLIGNNTWKRKLVDWEIYASMLDTPEKKRNGIIAFILPERSDYKHGTFYRYTIPPRLYDNYPNGYVKIYNWKDDGEFIKRVMAKAYERKDMLVVNQKRGLFSKNRDADVAKWDK